MKKSDEIKEEKDFLDAIERYKDIITKVCYYYASDAYNFHDIRQDVLAAIWYARHSFRGQSKLSTWIYRIALNTCISAMRKQKLKGKNIPVEAIEEVMNEESDVASFQEMHALINGLKSEDKAIILMWLDDFSYEDIADVTGIPRNTVATKVRRIKLQIVELAKKDI